MRTHIESFKISNCYGTISHKDGWSEGFLATPTGIVDIMTDHKNEHVRFDACLNGKHYIKTLNEVSDVEIWSDKKLKAQARIFMAEILQAGE